MNRCCHTIGNSDAVFNVAIATKKFYFPPSFFILGEKLPTVKCENVSCKCNKHGLCLADEISVDSCEFPSQCRTKLEL